MLCDIKGKIESDEVREILSACVFDSSAAGLQKEIERYLHYPELQLHGWIENEQIRGVVGFEVHTNRLEICHIATREDARRKGIGRQMISVLQARYTLPIEAETDNDAIGFYRKCGFADTAIQKYNVTRYLCTLMKDSCSVIAHYDAIIDEINNPDNYKVVDPVRNPEPLKEYMDKWDGQAFIDALQLTPGKSVLEIGIGTGRLAVRVAPLCGEFTGIDISPKTIEWAGENLKELENVTLICADFMEYDFSDTSHADKYDIVYSSLTFMHIADKQKAIRIVSHLLKSGGRFVLSNSKDQSDCIDYGTRKIKIYPDNPEGIREHMKVAGLAVAEQFETEFAVVVVAEKEVLK